MFDFCTFIKAAVNSALVPRHQNIFLLYTRQFLP